LRHRRDIAELQLAECRPNHREWLQSEQHPLGPDHGNDQHPQQREGAAIGVRGIARLYGISMRLPTESARNLIRTRPSISACRCERVSNSMTDLLFVTMGLGFFAAACLYLFACDRL
jgi:hypothetical protein